MAEHQQTFIERLDSTFQNAAAEWNVTSTVLLVIFLAILGYSVFSAKEPDVHPYLLARQAGTSPIRQSGQSAVYRAIEIPFGYPLRAGLGVKDPGAPRWTSGRDGDLRDIWRRAVQGPTNDDGSPTGEKAKIVTVLGRETVIENEIKDLTQDMNAVGSHLQQAGSKKVAICLSNSVEFLQSTFATAFYGSSPTLVPFGLTQVQTTDLLSQAAPDALIAEAGTLDLSSISSSCPSLKHVILVARAGGEHVDWSETSAEISKKLKVTTWADVVKPETASEDVPAVDKDSTVGTVSTFWPTPDQKFTLVEYTQKNLISAVAALSAVLPRTQRLTESDLVLPLSPLWLSYPLCYTLAALYNHSSIALNSIAGMDSVDVELASSGIKPTVMIASTLTALSLHTKTSELFASPLAPLYRWSASRHLHAGNLSSSSSSTPPSKLTNSPLSSLRLLLLAHRAGDISSPTLTSSMLTDLRIFPGVPLAYALTTANVCGAITQTNILDYRTKDQEGDEHHFGAPLSSVEVFIRGEDEEMEKGVVNATGELVARGPSVVGGETSVSVRARFNEDHTLSLV